MKVDEEQWVLMSTEGLYDHPNGMMGVFLGERSGHIKRIKLIGTYPYFYTLLTEKELRELPTVEKEFIRKDGKWSTRVIGFERVKKRHPITHKMIHVTKVYMKSRWDCYNQRDGTGLANFIPMALTFNKGHKFEDYFLNDYGLVMGMPYKIGKDHSLSMIMSEPTEEIMSIVKEMGIPRYLNEALVKKMLPLFFTDFAKIYKHVLAGDIEVDNDYKRALNPFQARYPISAISLYGIGYQQVFALNDKVRKKNYAYTLPEKINIDICKTESELIRKALKVICKTTKKKIVVWFNGDKFDMPYLMYRAHILKIHEFDSYIWARWDNYRQTIIKGIKGKFLMDLFPFFSNQSIKNYTFNKTPYLRNSLDDITEALLGVSKYKFEGRINELNAEELSYYNYVDTLRTFQLTEFNNSVVMDLILMFMRISGRTFEDVHRRRISAVITGMVNTTIHGANMLQPNKVQLAKIGGVAGTPIIKGKKFQGAEVLDPETLKSTGFHIGSVTCVDFASLYPSEIKQRNLCFSTVNCSHEKCMDNKMPSLPHHVCKYKKGVLASLIGFIRDIRVMYFKKYKKDNPVFGIVEQTLKVLINAGYGVFGDEDFLYFAAPVAEGTTAYGRRDILKVKAYCEKRGVRVLYGDTDSLFLLDASDEFLVKLFAWVKKELKLEMDIDYQGRYMLIHKKKNYIIDNEGKLVIKGMTGKKSNTPEFIRDCFTDVTNIIKENWNDVDKMKKIIEDTIMEYSRRIDHREFDILKMKITVKLGKWLHEYKVEGRQVKAARKLINYLRDKINDPNIPDALIVPKDTYIDFVIEKDGRKNKSPQPIEMLEDGSKIHSEYYKEHLVKTLRQILQPLNINEEQFLIDHNQLTLEGWF